MEQNNTVIKLTRTEKQRLIRILQKVYEQSINLFEISEVKSILQKLGEVVLLIS